MKKNNKKVLLTPEGLEELKKQYEEMVKVKRPGVVERVSRARDFGDLTENAEYASAREELDLVDNQIADLKATLSEVQVVTVNNKTDYVTIGTTIIVEADGITDEFTIVGSLEADPNKGKISNESAVGKALLGAKRGDTVKIGSTIETVYKVKEIK